MSIDVIADYTFNAIAITFGDEVSRSVAPLKFVFSLRFFTQVNRIWSREWTGATWLFALNRYFTELVFIVNVVCKCIYSPDLAPKLILYHRLAFHDPSWNGKVSASRLIVNTDNTNTHYF